MKNTVTLYLFNGEYHYLESIIEDFSKYNIDEFNDIYFKLENKDLVNALRPYFLDRIINYGFGE